MSTPNAETKNNGAAIEPRGPGNPTIVVGQQVRKLVESNRLHLPADFSAENALKSAWLALQNVQDKDKRPALQVCSPPSVINALLDMIVQGLNPMKKQCYFIVYGNQLTLQRSYFGDMLLAQRVKPTIEFYYGAIYEGDIFLYEMVRGRKHVTKHEQKLENIVNDKLKAVYCGLLDTITGEDLGVEVMTMEQVVKSWAQSKTFKFENSTHKQFPVEMALRTVIRKKSKAIINASNDQLLLEAIQRQELDGAEAEVDEEAMLHANGDVIDVEAVETAGEGEAETTTKEPPVTTETQPALTGDAPY